MPPKQRIYGFRCSWSDMAVLAACVPLTWWAWRSIGVMAGVIPFAVGHFFLFCNVFRIHRRREFVWAVLAVMNVSAWTLADALDWRWVLAVQTPITIACVGSEMRGKRYHGIYARRVNPSLDQWLSGGQP